MTDSPSATPAAPATREDVVALLAAMLSSRALWNVDKLDDLAWAGGVIEELLDTLSDIDPEVWS